MSRFEFNPDSDGKLSSMSAIGQAMGWASMCWEPKPTGVFQSGQAEQAMGLLYAQLDPDIPKLGLATTRQLLQEIEARMRISQNSPKGRELGRFCQEAIDNLASSILEYRTVGGG